MEYVRLIPYLWAVYEVGSLVGIINMKYTNTKDTALKGYLVMSVGVLSSVIFAIFISFFARMFPEFGEAIRTLIALPVLIIAYGARIARK